MNNDPVRLFFCGDFCSKPSTSLINVSDEVRSLINSCDLKVCNFEVPLKPDNVSEIEGTFYQNNDAPRFLEELGFNLFSFSNNHVFDYGEEGFKKTVNTFSDRNSIFGSGTYEEAYKVKTVEVKGVVLGLLALCYNAKEGVFDYVANKERLGCAHINDLSVNHIIIEAKKKVDFLFILAHDGIEYIDTPLPETIARYRDFINYGADGVIGTHPHCPQGWEEYKGRPIFYSLGNFFFNSMETPEYRAWNRPHWYESLGVVLQIENSKITYKVYNLKNKNNIKILLDERDEIKDHNQLICNYLVDEKSYEEYLDRELIKIVKSQHLPILSRSLEYYSQSASIKIIIKLLVKNSIILIKSLFFKLIRHERRTKDRSLIYLIKNDTRRFALIRILNKEI